MHDGEGSRVAVLGSATGFLLAPRASRQRDAAVGWRTTTWFARTPSPKVRRDRPAARRTPCQHLDRARRELEQELGLRRTELLDREESTASELGQTLELRDEIVTTRGGSLTGLLGRGRDGASTDLLI